MKIVKELETIDEFIERTNMEERERRKNMEKNLVLTVSEENEKFITAKENWPIGDPDLGYYPGVGYKFVFDNEYGASVVKHFGSYGYDSDEWELAVTDKLGHLVYDTPITDDVLGHLSDEEVDEILNDIKSLTQEDIEKERIRREIDETIYTLESLKERIK